MFNPIDKLNIIAECLDNQFRAHDLCENDHRRHLEAQLESLLAIIDEDFLVNFRSYDISKYIEIRKGLWF
jgi:hypothetical protein